MKLYYTKGACSLVCRIVINELGLDCDYESVDLRSKKTESGRDFLTVNPKGAVPVLQLESGDILTENAVILQYLADSSNATNLLPPVGYFDRYHVLEWLNYTTTELHKSFGPMFNPSLAQTIKEEIYVPLIKSKLNYVNAHLQHNKYLLGEQFTLPDAYMYVMLLWAKYFRFDLEQWPALVRYVTDLNQRESIKTSLAQE